MLKVHTYKAENTEEVACLYFLLGNAHVDVSGVHCSGFQSADGSAENQMIVESDDFNRPPYPCLLYKRLSKLIYAAST